MLYLIYAFFVDEQRAWTTGKDEPQMMKSILAAIGPAPSIGAESTGISNESFPTTPDSLVEPLDDAPPVSSKKLAKTSKSKALAA
jgi:hypothetical protein